MDLQPIALSDLSCSMHPFQSQFWAGAKSESSWKALAFEISNTLYNQAQLGGVYQLLVLVRSFGPFELAYIPFGPSEDLFENLGELSVLLSKHLSSKVFAIRWDLPFGASEPNLDNRAFRILCESVQPDGTVQLDLRPGYKYLQENYRTRAKRALKKNDNAVKVRLWNGSDEELEKWYSLYKITSERDGFSMRPFSYIQNLLSLSDEEVSCKLYLAFEQETMTGGIMVLCSKPLTLFLFGASEREGTLNCSYSLQDRAIKDACESGSLIYDFYGIQGDNGRGSHLKGLEQFKKGFGGVSFSRTPTVDFVLRPCSRFLFSLAETVRFRLARLH